jgi:hypothetical protein
MNRIFPRERLGKLGGALLLALALIALPAAARENSYDIFGKVLRPFANLFVASPGTAKRAVTADLSIEQATNLPSEAAGEVISIRLQNPDKVYLSGVVLGQAVVVCRDGQQLWAYPGTKISALIGNPDLPPADPDFKIAPFQLPVSSKQLVFLPALFQVRDAGDETVEGVECRVLDVVLMPELARSLKVSDWAARLWVRPDYTPARVEVLNEKWHAVIGIKKLVYAPSLPPEMWQPSPEQSQDLLQLTPARFKQLIDAAAQSFTCFKYSSESH